MDHQIFLAINGLGGRSLLLDKIGLFFGGEYFLYLFLLGAASLWLVPLFRKQVYIMVAAILVGRGLVTQILKLIIGRARLYAVLNAHQMLVDHDNAVSFPSD